MANASRLPFQSEGGVARRHTRRRGRAGLGPDPAGADRRGGGWRGVGCGSAGLDDARLMGADLSDANWDGTKLPDV